MIRYENVSLAYGDKSLFTRFNLTIDRGEKVVLFGPSGTGKSTLLKLLLGFAVPDAGTVFFNDTPVKASEVWTVRRRFTYVPQSPDIGEGSVQEIVETVFALKANDRWEDNNNQLSSHLKAFRLDPEILKKDFASLSGGEKQRIVLIIGILMGRKIFLLDEVTSSLDAEMKKIVVDGFAEQTDWTVIAVSHDSVWNSRKEFRTVPIGGER